MSIVLKKDFEGAAAQRNVAMTGPYFHDGSVASLPDAVKTMARVELGATLGNREVSDIVASLDSPLGHYPKVLRPRRCCLRNIDGRSLWVASSAAPRPADLASARPLFEGSR
jgi:hypothetical protein